MQKSLARGPERDNRYAESDLLQPEQVSPKSVLGVALVHERKALRISSEASQLIDGGRVQLERASPIRLLLIRSWDV